MLGVLLFLVVASAPANGKLEKLFVLHRHGARTSLGVGPGGKLLCNYPYCQLTSQGKSMCNALGRSILDEYVRTGAVELSAIYNVTEMQSVSTAVPRVVVSGEAAVLGLYPDGFPFVDFSPIDEDLGMSFWTSWPTWQIRQTYDVETVKLDAYARTLFFDEDLTVLGHQLGIDWCATRPSDCIGFAYDSAVSNTSLGFSLEPAVASLLEKMHYFMARFFYEMLGYVPSDDYKRAVGAYGNPLGQELMHLLTSAEINNFQYKIFHRAAHDWTLFPFYGVLGAWNTSNWNDTRWVIQFAEAVIVELHSGNASEPLIRARWGAPQQDSRTVYEYSWQPLVMRCIAPDGQVSHSSECPLSYVWRQINSTMPVNDDPLCFASQSSLREQNCAEPTAPPTNATACRFFRSRCPNVQCGPVPNSVADAARDFACVSTDTSTQDALAVGVVVAVGIATLAIGASVGYLLGGRLEPLFHRWCRKS